MDGDIVLDMVDNLNHNAVTFSCNDSRTRKLPVHGHYAFRLAQSRHILHFNLE